MPPVCGDHVGRDEIVAGQPLSPGEVADATTQGEPPDAGGGDDPSGGRQPEGIGGVVEVPQVAPPPARAVRDVGSTRTCASATGRSPGRRPRCQTRERCAHPPNGDLQRRSAGVADCGDDVGGVAAAHDHRRAAVVHPVVDLAVLVVSRVAGVDHRSADVSPGGSVVVRMAMSGPPGSERLRSLQCGRPRQVRWRDPSEPNRRRFVRQKPPRPAAGSRRRRGCSTTRCPVRGRAARARPARRGTDASPLPAAMCPSNNHNAASA